MCTNDVHYIKKNDADAYDTLCCIRNGKKKNAPVPEGEYFFKSTDEMKDLFSWCPEALNNTSRIAELCTLDFCEYEKSRLEHPYPEIHQNPDEYLAALVNSGLKKRFETITDEINDRLKAEMETIKEKGWTDFFIIVHDVVSWVRKEGITIVPGRWKYVSSLVCYLLEITDINPFEYGLIYEDFINKKSCILEKIKPQNISELAAAIAISFHYAEPLFDILDIDTYIKKQKVFDPDLSEILKDINGHIIFEEQKVHAISVLFESTINEALYAFRSIYEGSESRIDALKKEYIEKAAEKGIEQQYAEKTFYIIKYIIKYKKLLLLKAECIPCAIETYQLAYIAAYYPEIADEVFNF